MKLEMLAMFDEKIGEFMTPFFAQSTGAAVRSVGDLVNGTGGEPPAQHPEDFKLYHLGVWHGEGAFELDERPTLVCECANLKRGVN